MVKQLQNPGTSPANDQARGGESVAEAAQSTALPDTPLAQATLRLLGAATSAPIANHSIRGFLFARLLGHRLGMVAGRDHDEGLLFVACALHDLGVAADARRQQRFEVEGADRAAEFLTGYGLAANQVDQVWQAIALHTSPGIADRRGALCLLTRHGIAYDFGGALGAGPAPDAVTDDQARTIHQAYPRLAMVRSLVDAIVAHAAANPHNAPPYSVPGEFLRERGMSSRVTRLEQAAASSRWPD